MRDAGHNGGPPLDWHQYGGFIAEARDARHHPVIGYGKQVRPADPDRVLCYSVNEAWRDLLHECKYRDGQVDNGGRTMQIKRGELVGAISWLANRWNWSPKTVRGFLERLEREGMISRYSRDAGGAICPLEKGNQSGNRSAIISICNYKRFQGSAGSDWHSEGQSKGNQLAIEGQSKGNNIKKNKGTKEQGNNEDTPQTPNGGSSPDDPPKLTLRTVAREAFVEWQDFALDHALPVPRDSTFEAFAEQISARMREHAETQNRVALLEVWHIALCNFAKSKFLRGLTGGDFKADLATITRPKNFAKLISGGYGSGATAAHGRWRISQAPVLAPSAPLTTVIDSWEFKPGDQ